MQTGALSYLSICFLMHSFFLSGATPPPAPTILGGLANQYVYTTPYDFSAESNPVSLVGFVWFNGGFIASQRNVGTLNIVAPVGGVINFNNSTKGFLLKSDLFLGRSVTWVNNGVINGGGYAIQLSNALSYSSTLQFTGNTILDGNKNTVTLASGGSFSVAAGVTLTLRNMMLVMSPGASLTVAIGATVLFDNVTVVWQQDATIATGSWGFKGKCRFVSAQPVTLTFSSPGSISINAYSFLKLGSAVTLKHACATNRNTFVFANQTSVLVLGGGGIISTAASILFASGRLKINRAGGFLVATSAAAKIKIMKTTDAQNFIVESNPSILQGSFTDGILSAQWI